MRMKRGPNWPRFSEEPFSAVVDAFGREKPLGRAVVAPGVFGAELGRTCHFVGPVRLAEFIVEYHHHVLFVGNQKVGLLVVQQPVGIIDVLFGYGIYDSAAVFGPIARLAHE